MSYRNIGHNYRGHSAPHPLQIMARYVGFSALLWVAMSIAGFIFLSDFRITDQFQMDAWANFSTARSTLINSFGLVLLSAGIGIVAALPALLALFSLQPRIESMQRKSGKSRSVSLMFLKQVPTLGLLGTEFLLVSLSLGAAPQLARSWTQKPNLISEWSMFIYELFYYPLENDHIASRWREALAPGKGIQTLNVYLPASLLSDPGSFPRLKKLLGDAQPFFLTAPTVPALLAQVSFGESAVERKYLSPVFSSSEFNSTQGSKSADFFLRSEWHAMEQNSNATLEKKESTSLQWDRNEAIRMRLAQSQFPLFLFFRLGLMTLVHENWQWKNIASDDAHELDKFVEKMLSTKTPVAPIQNIQLGEMEHDLDFVKNPFAPLDWPTTLVPKEYRWLVAKLDIALSVGLSQVKDRKDFSVFVLPFPEKILQIPFAQAFFMPAETSIGSGTTLHTNNEQWLTPADVYALSQKSEIDKKSLIVLENSTAQCLPLLLNPAVLPEILPQVLPGEVAEELLETAAVKSSYLQNMLWEVVRENSGEKFFYPESFAFLPLSKMEPMVFCREFLKSAIRVVASPGLGMPAAKPENTQRSWLFRMKPENALLENIGEDDASIATLSQSILREPVVERVEKKVDRPVTLRRVNARKIREQQRQQVKVLAIYDVWELKLLESRKPGAKLIPEEDQEILLETFEPVLKNLFEQIAREQLK